MSSEHSQPRKVLCIFGTRPEAIKMAPLILAMQRAQERFTPQTCVTGQHRQMLDQVLKAFDIVPDLDLAIMSHNQTLAELTARALRSVDDVLVRMKPDIVLVQGDTTTAAAAALAAFYRQIPLGHVEAGLRTGDLADPFPEEANRVLIDHLADYCFAPTSGNRATLLNEGVSADRIFVTGNTGIDALLITRAKIADRDPETWSDVWGSAAPALRDPSVRLALITMHRRESFGPRLRRIFESIRTVALKNPSVHFVYPVHLNPNVVEPAEEVLGNLPNIHLIEPLAYEPFVYLMNRAAFIITDSGGIQEEAPSLGKRVVVVRDKTERQEALEGGLVKLGGTDPQMLVPAIESALKQRDQAPHSDKNPYGDGDAANKILRAVIQFPRLK